MAVDGDTEIMNDDVQNSWPDETMEVRQELLDASPYLSDTVMLSAADKEDVLPNAILTEVLVANPQSANSSKVMEAVDQRDTLLNQTQYDQIMQGKLIAGAKEKLEARISSAKSKREFAMKNLIMAWHDDTLVNATDSIIELMENEESLNAKYALVETYLNLNDTTSAISTYISLNTNFALNNREYNNWLIYGDFLAYKTEQISKGKSISEPDSLQLVSLYQLYNSSENHLRSSISNLLRFCDTLTYQEPYLTVDTSFKQSNVKFRPAENSTIKDELLVYPNPARTYFIIDFTGFDINEELIVANIFSMGGKQLKEIHINSNSGFKVIDTRMWTPGTYLISLNVGGKIIGSGTVLLAP